MSFEPAPGIYGGSKSLEAYLAFMGVGSLEELQEKQLSCAMSGGRVHIVSDEHGEVSEYELRPRPDRRELSHDEELELRALCGLAWERRHEPDFREHVDAITDWFDRRHVRAVERRQRSHAAVLQVLRETDPQ